MTTLQEKKAILKTLTDGAEITLITGEMAIFHNVLRTNFVYTKNGVRYKGPITNFHCISTLGEQSHKTTDSNSKRSASVQERYNLVRQAAFGDLITLTDGMVVHFIKINKTRFVGKDVATQKQYTIRFLSVWQNH